MDESVNNIPNENGEKPFKDPKTGRFVEGNPGGGRPKGSNLSITSLVKAELEKIPEGQKLTYAEAFIKKILHKAIIEGDQQTQKMIWNYMDGLPKASVDIGVNTDKETLSGLTEFFKSIAKPSLPDGQQNEPGRPESL